MSRGTGLGIGALALVSAAAIVVPGRVGADQEKDAHREIAIRAVRMAGGGARLGVVLDEVGKADVSRLKLAEERGALVKEVVPESPAARAGIEKSDVILGYQGEAVRSAAQLARLVRETPPGRQVTIELSRDGATRKLSATVDRRGGAGRGRRGGRGGALDFDFDLDDLEMPAPPAPPAPPRLEWHGDDVDVLVHRMGRGPAKLGIRYQELGDQLAAYFKVDAGLLVTRVEDDGPAAKAGVRAGDVLREVNGRPVRDARGLRAEVRRLESGASATLSLTRDGKPLELKVTVGGRGPAPGRSTT